MSKKGRDEVTLLIIPHTEKGPISIKFPVSLVRIAAAVLLITLTFGAVLIQSYSYMSKEVDELVHLKEVTRAQKAEIEILASQTQNLMEQMQEVEELSLQVREILDLQQEVVDAEIGGLTLEEVEDEEAGRLLTSRGGARDSLSMENLRQMGSSLEKKAEELENLVVAAEEYQVRMDHKPSIWPAKGRVTSPFGYRRSPFTGRLEFHSGIDIGNSRGTPIVAAAHGRIVEASYRGGWGRLIIIDHGNDFKTWYAHLNRFAASTGDQVEKGEVIGYMGSSGASTGPHLHYEVHVKNERVNPLTYID